MFNFVFGTILRFFESIIRVVMSEPQTPPPPSQPPVPPSAPPSGQAKDGEIPLEDIDRLLESEDPEFTKSLEEVRAVESDKDIVIDASAIDETLGDTEAAAVDGKNESRWSRWRLKLRMAWVGFKMRLKARLIQMAIDFFIFLKTRPKEFFFFLVSTSKILYKKSLVPLKAFKEATRVQKLTVLVLMTLAVACAWILMANLRGIWLPLLSEPPLQSFAAVADSVETYKPKEEGESFYSAFPQERHEFLFPKMKVNLKRTEDNPNPMGAFEIVVLVDSKDTAIEVSDREVEFSDMLQRVFEDETFNDLASELGKNRLKSRLKRELNQKLTQGWAKDINFKTFVLKP